MIGHNNGPTMEKGTAWRAFAWKKARVELLPKMPIEVVRRRVKRAGELGIDYKSYAGIRAATGRDIVALLFSDNALRLLRDGRIEENRAAQMGRVLRTDLLAMVHPPFDPHQVLSVNELISKADKAPDLHSSWGETRQRILDLKGDLPGDGLVVVGETMLERGWSEAGRLAGYIPAARYFGQLPTR